MPNVLTEALWRARCARFLSMPAWAGYMSEFKIGQYVFYHPINRVRAEGQYVVIAVYRQPDGEVRYVIRRQDDPSHEYTAEAQELRTRSRLRSS